MEDRFQSLSNSQMFENLIQIADVFSWPTEENALSTYCDEEILLVVNHYVKLLSQNGCNIEEIPPKWDRVKAYLGPILKSQTKIDHLEVWKSIFTNGNVKRECRNVLHVCHRIIVDYTIYQRKT